MQDDELLSINEVARLWGTGLAAVLNSIQTGQLMSLDRGLLAAEARYDVPMIRRSWAEAPRQDSPGASRLLEAPAGEPSHPAAQVAFDFHKALDLGDAAKLYDTSSAESRGVGSREELLEAWRTVGGHLTQPNAGVGTAVYTLAPLGAVAARVFADAPTLPRAVTRSTPASLIDPLPLVLEGAGWKVDLPLFERRQEWSHLLTSSLVDSSASPESSVSRTPRD